MHIYQQFIIDYLSINRFLSTLTVKNVRTITWNKARIINLLAILGANMNYLALSSKE